MGKEFFNVNEKTDYEMLTNLNDAILHLNEIGETPLGHYTDASGYTCSNRYMNMELKNRNQELRTNEKGEYYIHGWKDDGSEYDCNGVYIEQHKVCDMLLDYVVHGYEPIYINFLKNCIIVYNLSKLKNRPQRFKRKIKSKGYDKIEIGTREDLHINDATIYDNNYRLIKLPNDK